MELPAIPSSGDPQYRSCLSKRPMILFIWTARPRGAGPSTMGRTAVIPRYGSYKWPASYSVTPASVPYSFASS
eukprot:8937609-Heterocapsa_arctica.AAC.1